jgi:hypothetical protein
MIQEDQIKYISPTPIFTFCIEICHVSDIFAGKVFVEMKLCMCKFRQGPMQPKCALLKEN